MKKIFISFALAAFCCTATTMAETAVGDTIKVVNADPAYTLYYKVTNATEESRNVALVPQSQTAPYYNVYPSGDVVIPDSVYDGAGNAFAVRAIEANALSECKDIKTLTFKATDYISLPNNPFLAGTPLDTLDITKFRADVSWCVRAFQGNLIKWFKGKNNWYAGILLYLLLLYPKKLAIGVVCYRWCPYRRYSLAGRYKNVGVWGGTFCST